MSFSPSVLLLDEPTSALAAKEVGQLFALVRRLRQRLVTMIYITHRIPEPFQIADTCTVLRDGKLVGSIELRKASTDGTVKMMFRDVARATRPPRRRRQIAEPVLTVERLTRPGTFEDVSFTLHRGEILRLAGTLGASRSEVLRSIFGAERFASGDIRGARIERPTPRGMKRRGLGYTPESRKHAGLVRVLSIHDNLCLASLDPIAPRGFVTRAMETPYVVRQIADLSTRTNDPHLPVSSLSGGNQQKVVIGNWLNIAPRALFFDEPSRGIDVQAKQQIFQIVWSQAERGVAVVFVSTELEELIEVCNRIVVLHHGRLVAKVRPGQTTLAEFHRLRMEGAPDVIEPSERPRARSTI